MKKTKIFLFLLLLLVIIYKIVFHINMWLPSLFFIMILSSFYLVFALEKMRSFDQEMITKIKNMLFRINETNIHTIQAYKNSKKTIVYLNYYFSTEYNSGLQLVFTIVNDKLKFLKYGKFGWRDEKYKTLENEKIINDFITKIENENII